MVRRTIQRAFTLVEILIVVVILGILAAIVVPNFVRATSDAQEMSTLDQLAKLRSAVATYFVRSNSVFPSVTAGDGTWGELLSQTYLRAAPSNFIVPPPNDLKIVIGTRADTTYDPTHAWIYNPATGDVWAAGIDANGNIMPRP